MDDLVVFLEARLDEDEYYLRTVTEIGERKRDSMTEADFAAALPGVMDLMSDPGILQIMKQREALGYAPPNDVPRLFEEIAAKRAILARHHPQDHALHGRLCAWCSSASVSLYQKWPCPDARDLATIYSGHPAYQSQWKPPQPEHAS